MNETQKTIFREKKGARMAIKHCQIKRHHLC